MALDPVNTSIAYAGTFDGMFVSNNGGDSWDPTDLDFFYTVKSIAVDPVNPSRIYATVTEYDLVFGSVYQDSVVRSEDGGATWNDAVNNGIRGMGTTRVTIDPSHPNVLFLGTASGVFRSVDGARSWHRTPGITNQTWALTVVPSQDAALPSTVYAGTSAGIYRSTDGGDSWASANKGIAMRFINALLVDAKNPATIFAGGDLASSAFVTRLSPTGASLDYSTYLSADGNDVALAIAVDSAGSAIVVGRTDSSAFPTSGPLQTTGQGGGDAFLARLKNDGSGLTFATYFGGSAYDEARGIALDSAGSMYLAGFTASADFPRGTPLQPALGDRLGDGFVVKLADTPAAPTPAPGVSLSGQ